MSLQYFLTTRSPFVFRREREISPLLAVRLYPEGIYYILRAVFRMVVVEMWRHGPIERCPIFHVSSASVHRASKYIGAPWVGVVELRYRGFCSSSCLVTLSSFKTGQLLTSEFVRVLRKRDKHFIVGTFNILAITQNICSDLPLVFYFSFRSIPWRDRKIIEI